ncbi:TSCPD domain-containing protein [Hungatella hathewayi]|uniref:TSCPD domain-containing protein n=1 Tax=Hungatella hathewayi TaxID=154046 RepID=A0A3E4TTR5_9FIRM|nr:TSCPD domain-containing protein [Hungatella hathewayi]RGO66626.1 TSCPD domain-containing protein [Hungatella hathewayi]RHM71154.1 TSCPD domain-containing protein [Hungatella hathewayi]
MWYSGSDGRPTSCPDQMAQALEQYLTGAAQPQ